MNSTQVLNQGAIVTINNPVIKKFNGTWEWYNTVGSIACLRKLGKRGQALAISDKNTTGVEISNLDILLESGWLTVDVGSK